MYRIDDYWEVQALNVATCIEQRRHGYLFAISVMVGTKPSGLVTMTPLKSLLLGDRDGPARPVVVDVPSGLVVPRTSTCPTLREFACSNKLPQMTLEGVAVRSGQYNRLSYGDAPVRIDKAKQFLGERS